jgi:hypothetical protein
MEDADPHNSPKADAMPDAGGPSQETAGCGIILLGVVVGAILGGVLLCVAVQAAWDREKQAMDQEIRERLANGEDDAERQVIMEHKTMPIAVAMGFFMELGVAAVVGGGIGGVLAAQWKRRSAQQEESSVACRVVRYEHSPDPPPAGSTSGPRVE